MSWDDSAAQWRRFGEVDPYYGVIAKEEYRRPHLTADALDRFYAGGAEYIDWLLGQLGSVDPESALDFGCGVGRVLVALAQRCGQVTGVDIAPAMLVECRKACDERGIQNVTLSEHLPDEQFDLVHSTLVLQHIAPREGYGLIGELAGRLSATGVGALHVTLRAASVRARAFFWVTAHVPLAANVWNLLRGRPWSYPHMQMNEYRLERVLDLLSAQGISNVRTICEPASGPMGFHAATVVFQREPRVRDIRSPG